MKKLLLLLVLVVAGALFWLSQDEDIEAEWDNEEPEV